jgi:hypothetical protein
MTPTNRNRFLIAMACIAALALSAQAARESGADDIETIEHTAQAVDDTDAAARQVEADHLFDQRVQLTGDTICIRTHGPSYRATWQGKDESMHCVQRGPAPPRDRLMLAEGGAR